MEVKACKNCKRLFKYMFGPELCQDCIKLVTKGENDIKLTATLKPIIAEDEEKYIQVKDYIMTHPKATIVQISDANDILPKKLFEWIRAERLEFSRESEYAWFECERCGAKIKSGRFCNKCKVR